MTLPDDGYLLLVSQRPSTQKILTRKERIILNLYLLGGFCEAVEMRTLVNAVYGGEGWGFYGGEYKSKYGSIWRDCMMLKIAGYLERFNNPVRWRLKYSRNVARRLVYILHKLGFKKANIRDFGFI